MSHTLGDSLRQKAGKALQTAAGLSAVFVARNLSPSVASLAQRLAGCGRTTDTLPSGSPLLVSLAGVAEHSGIYVPTRKNNGRKSKSVSFCILANTIKLTRMSLY